MANKIMTLQEVAAYLRVHPSTVYRLLRKQGFPGFKVGSDWRFDQGTVDRWCRAPGGLHVIVGGSVQASIR